MLIPNLKTKFKKSVLLKSYSKKLSKKQLVQNCNTFSADSNFPRTYNCTWLFQSAAGLSADSNSPREVRPRTVIVHNIPFNMPLGYSWCSIIGNSATNFSLPCDIKVQCKVCTYRNSILSMEKHGKRKIIRKSLHFYPYIYNDIIWNYKDTKNCGIWLHPINLTLPGFAYAKQFLDIMKCPSGCLLRAWKRFCMAKSA